LARARDRGRRLPRQSKTIPRKGNPDRGNGLDDGRYYRCWHCGFLACNEDRDALGDGQSGNGVSHEDYYNPAVGGSYDGDPLNSVTVLGGSIEHFHVTLELGSDGEPKGIRHDLRPVVNSGCPFCGSLNWRGDY